MIRSLVVDQLTVMAWVLDDPSAVTKTKYRTTHVGDHYWLGGCNRVFGRAYVFHTEELGGQRPLCASHVQSDPPQS